MSHITFIRTTHRNGRFRPYPTEAYKFWGEHGWLVGGVLRQEEALSFSQITRACQELLEEHPERWSLPIDEKYIAWCLVKLLEFGMAATVTQQV